MPSRWFDARGHRRFTLADGSATPGLGLIVSGAGWVLLADGVVCVIAIGLGSLTGSRGITLTALIGWELVLSPQLLQASSLGSGRQGLLDGALVRIGPTRSPTERRICRCRSASSSR